MGYPVIAKSSNLFFSFLVNLYFLVSKRFLSFFLNVLWFFYTVSSWVFIFIYLAWTSACAFYWRTHVFLQFWKLVSNYFQYFWSAIIYSILIEVHLDILYSLSIYSSCLLVYFLIHNPYINHCCRCWG